MNPKEINKLIENIVFGNDNLYDLRCNFIIKTEGVSLLEAQAAYNDVSEEQKQFYSITTSKYVPPYTEDLELAMKAVKKICDKVDEEKNGLGAGTFVLTYSGDEGWKGCFGSYFDHVEVTGDNPAYVSCMSILKYMGKA